MFCQLGIASCTAAAAGSGDPVGGFTARASPDFDAIIDLATVPAI
jgi:hypothetical protein